MASWMVHLRVAEKIFEKMACLSEVEYVMGNIAPDSGVPNEDWSVFTPSSALSHYSHKDENGLKVIDIDKYTDIYLSEERCVGYNNKQFSFYLGYYNHLLTDVLWVEHVVNPSRERDIEAYTADPVGTVWKWKKDWYDLDFLYLQNHPDFHAFYVYENAVGFENTFLDYFAEDAFDNRRQYITDFYRTGRENLDREYPWLTELEMSRFVDIAVQKILEKNENFRRWCKCGNESIPE